MKILRDYLRNKDYLKGRKPFKVTQELREKVQVKVKEILKFRKEIILAVLFGSFVEKDFARDIDLAIYLVKVTDLYDALEYSEILAKNT